MSVFTARQMTFGLAPKRLDLHGDKRRKTEPAQHVLTFPGGAVEISRTEGGDYWVHVHVNRTWATEDHEGMRGAHGEVADSRVVRRSIGGRATNPEDVPGAEDIEQFALLVRPSRPGGES